jgi:hypothetical protein
MDHEARCKNAGRATGVFPPGSEGKKKTLRSGFRREGCVTFVVDGSSSVRRDRRRHRRQIRRVPRDRRRRPALRAAVPH